MPSAWTIKLCLLTVVQSTRHMPMSEQLDMAFLQFVFSVLFVAKSIHYAGKVSEDANRKLSARNTLVQLLAHYIDPSAIVHSVITITHGRTDRQTDDIIMPLADHIVQQYGQLKIIHFYRAMH